MGKENLKRRNPTPNKPSGSGGNNAPPVRKVRPVSTPEDIGRETPAPDGVPSNGTLIGKARDTMSAVGNSVGGALKNGFMGLKNNWFGVKPIKNATSSGVDSISNFLNLPKKVVSGLLITAIAGGGTAGGIAWMNHNSNEFIIRQEDYYDDCAEILADARGAVASMPAVGDASAQQMEVAEQMWALGKALGFTDEQCAGMLGNMQQESGLDPTVVEGIYTEPYTFGPKKAALFVGEPPEPGPNMNSYVTGPMLSSYAASNIRINLPAYLYDGSQYCCGIGLIQWTGPTAKQLVDFGKGHNNKPWYDLSVQCADMIGGDATQKTRIQGFLHDTANATSVDNATASWLGYMERGIGHAEVSGGFQSGNRIQYAHEWYTRLSGRSSAIESQYSQFANDTIAMAAAETAAATGNHLKQVEGECGSKQAQSYDNSNLAGAAVAYAWETKEMGVGNNGTELFRAVHDAMYPGDVWYQSCDRGVACAVAWSGADDNFPPGDTTMQDNYFQATSDLWECVGNLDSSFDLSTLEPGDIFCTIGNGHILMYVGNDIVREKYPNSDADTVSASYQTP